VTFTHLPWPAPLEAFEAQARALFDGWRDGAPEALAIFRECHPRFLRDDVPWLPRSDSDDARIREAALTHDDARVTIARWYDFLDWDSLVALVTDAADVHSPVARFEAAVEMVIEGHLEALEAAVRVDPALVHARSTRVTHFDPPRHRATLLHYVAANGVEGYRQRTPANAVAIARVLLEAGADADALADMYGGRCTTMSMLVSSTPPERAGVQVALVDLLVDFGASVEARGAGAWASPLMTALVFGFRPAAEALVRRGARVDTLAAAAGLGRGDDVRAGLAAATPDDRHRALALAAQSGHADVLAVLLDAGEDPSRYNPPGLHAHATPLHQAVASGPLPVVRLLVERGAPRDARDRIYDATPLEWAEYLNQGAIAAYLRGA